MASTTARVPTASGRKYMIQLCKHWSHKLEVELGEETALVKFPAAEARMAADEAGLTVTVEAESDETLERMKGVVSSHLDRFAFREAPLAFDWS